MNARKWDVGLYTIAGVYDAVLGVAFLVAPLRVYEWFSVPPPNHMGYVQFPAALLVIFGLIFFRIARDPGRHWDLIPFGILLKVSYCAVVFGHWAFGGIPGMWKPFAVIDVGFLVLFYLSYARLKRAA